MLTRQDAMAFAQQWAANWNRLAIDTIVDHFAPEGEMRSPLATKLAGSSTIKGRDAIRTYWHAALWRADRAAPHAGEHRLGR
ncbi:hypothetical protein [Tardiphaga robiniae]|nr:hypothetical protein [Tardiphaga robiniae]